jgi:hypothetical protein
MQCEKMRSFSANSTNCFFMITGVPMILNLDLVGLEKLKDE